MRKLNATFIGHAVYLVTQGEEPCGPAWKEGRHGARARWHRADGKEGAVDLFTVDLFMVCAGVVSILLPAYCTYLLVRVTAKTDRIDSDRRGDYL